MSFKDIFKNRALDRPEVVEVKQSQKPLQTEEIVYDFSYEEHRFGKQTSTGAFVKTYPVPKSLYGFFNFETEEISQEEYNMWKDCTKNPQLYIISSEALGRGMKKYTISLKKEQK